MCGKVDNSNPSFQVKFVDKLDERLSCPICKNVFNEPWQTSCGHRFCSKCLEGLLGYALIYCVKYVLFSPQKLQYYIELRDVISLLLWYVFQGEKERRRGLGKVRGVCPSPLFRPSNITIVWVTSYFSDLIESFFYCLKPPRCLLSQRFWLGLTLH